MDPVPTDYLAGELTAKPGRVSIPGEVNNIVYCRESPKSVPWVTGKRAQ